jgi:hypothetical protein
VRNVKSNLHLKKNKKNKKGLLVSSLPVKLDSSSKKGIHSHLHILSASAPMIPFFWSVSWIKQIHTDSLNCRAQSCVKNFHLRLHTRLRWQLPSPRLRIEPSNQHSCQCHAEILPPFGIVLSRYGSRSLLTQRGAFPCARTRAPREIIHHPSISTKQLP